MVKRCYTELIAGISFLGGVGKSCLTGENCLFPIICANFSCMRALSITC
jgi:hypothetical protein